jgi:DNA-binding NtrC family response regulator
MTGTAEHAAQEVGAPGKVLFMDDEPDIVEAFGLALGMMGYQSLGFTDPGKALAAFEADRGGILAVITDFTMPQMPCAEFIRRLRIIRPDVPIHLCTGNAQHEIQEAATDLAIKSILYKPFDYQTLEAFIGRLKEPQS